MLGPVSKKNEGKIRPLYVSFRGKLPPKKTNFLIFHNLSFTLGSNQ